MNNDKPKRAWCFTLNNPRRLPDLEHAKIKYAVMQLEVGENGTPHIQGYIELKSPQRFSWFRNHGQFGLGKAHFEPRYGSPQQARDYCMKADTRLEGPWEFGSFTGQGHRSDLLDVKAMIDDGKSLLDVANAHFGSFVRYRNGISAYQVLVAQPRSRFDGAILCIGRPGTGKSTHVLENFPGAYWKQPNSHWWDGYHGQTVVVLDEFSGWLPYSDVLRLLDKTPLLVQAKGTQIPMSATMVAITCNRPPEMWYSAEVFRKHEMVALLRRISTVLVFSGTPGTEEHYVREFNSYESFRESPYWGEFYIPPPVNSQNE